MNTLTNYLLMCYNVTPFIKLFNNTQPKPFSWKLLNIHKKNCLRLFPHMSFSLTWKWIFLACRRLVSNLSSSPFARNDICKCQWHNAILSLAIVSELLHESEADCVWDISPRDITSNSRRDYNSITHFAPRASSSETFLLLHPLCHPFISLSRCLAENGDFL